MKNTSNFLTLFAAAVTILALSSCSSSQNVGLTDDINDAANNLCATIESRREILQATNKDINDAGTTLNQGVDKGIEVLSGNHNN